LAAVDIEIGVDGVFCFVSCTIFAQLLWCCDFGCCWGWDLMPTDIKFGNNASPVDQGGKGSCNRPWRQRLQAIGTLARGKQHSHGCRNAMEELIHFLDFTRLDLLSDSQRHMRERLH